MYKEIVASEVSIEGKGDGDEYQIRCRDKDGKTQVVTAGALNLNGFAFATSGMEIGEYRRFVTIEKENEWSRYVNLKMPEPEAN